MQQKHLIFIAIIIGSIIIGQFVYLAILYGKSVEEQNNPAGALLNSYPAGKTVSGISLDEEIKPLEQQSSECGAKDDTIVTKVIDGDTVVVEGGYHVRLLGIDADEKGYYCYEPAKTRLEELVLNKEVRLERDSTDVDKYKRCLRNIFIENPSANSGQAQNIGLQLVKEGLAVARFYEPDVKYKNEIINAEQQAILNKAGCKWSNIK